MKSKNKTNPQANQTNTYGDTDIHRARQMPSTTQGEGGMGFSSLSGASGDGVRVVREFSSQANLSPGESKARKKTPFLTRSGMKLFFERVSKQVDEHWVLVCFSSGGHVVLQCVRVV
jgi:hypothetical protein